MTQVVARARDEDLIDDVVIADDGKQAAALWHLRESLPPAQIAEGASIKHDISLPVSRLPAFLARALPAIIEALPGVRPCPFGHVGDGNLHFNLSQSIGSDGDAFLAQSQIAHRVVHDIVVDMGGSIAAEHGIGRLKVEALARYKQPVELDMMRAIKTALDPHNRLNPGVIVER
jgi:D-lactate dehydrogenase (cytochrome)